MMVVDTPLAAAAAFQAPARVVEVTNQQPAPVAVMSKPKAVSEPTPFNWKRFLALPLLVIVTLGALVIWGAKRLRAARNSGPSA